MRFIARGTLGLDRFRLWLQTNTGAKRKRAYATSTINCYVHNLSLFVRWCAEHGITPPEATTDDVFDYLAGLSAIYAPNTVDLRHAILALYFDSLGREPNPARQIPVRHGPARRPAEPYSPNEVSRLYAACRNYQERAVFLLMLAAGPRRNEVFNVVRSDCNFATGAVKLHGKGAKDRYVYIEPVVVDALLKAFEFSDRLCPQQSNDYIYRLVRSLGKRAGIPGRHHPHRLRVTFAVQWCELGGQESELQILLGHSTAHMTAYYARVGRERRALRTMSSLQIAATLLGPASA